MSVNDEIDQWLDRAYDASGNREKLDNLYDEWAKDYDQHIWASGNPYIAVATGMAGRHVPDFDAAILDAGCGTGNMALLLHQMGYNNLEGLDPSGGNLRWCCPAVVRQRGRGGQPDGEWRRGHFGPGPASRWKLRLG